MQVVKRYVGEHSCLLGATKIQRATAHLMANRFGEMIGSMPFIKLRHFKVMVIKELGVFISNKVCRNARAFVLLRKLKNNSRKISWC